jgi:putative salt-induced outer membrane protein YdiY
MTPFGTSRALALALAAACLWPAGARAQSADDVASRVGTVARKVAETVPGPWSLDATFATDLSRGNADTTNLRATLLHVADSGRWRLASYLSGTVETTNGRRSKDRSGLNVALAHRVADALRLVVIEEIVRAPTDGIRWKNLLGGMAVWTPPETERIDWGVYAGAGWASESYTDASPSADYAAGLAGASATIALSETATLALVASYTQDLSLAAEYSVGSSAALRAAVNAVLGLHLSYAVSYDNRPAANRVRTNNAISAGVTLAFKGSN